MPKPKLYAAILRFYKPQFDGSYGVLGVDRPKAWRPTKKESAEINDICECTCDLFEDDTIEPGQIASFIPYQKPPKNWDPDADAQKAEALLRRAHEGDRYCVGLFPEHAVHPQHGTIQ